MKFVPGALSIKFHYKNLKFSKSFFKISLNYSAPFKHRSCIITILFRTEPNLLP